LFKGPGQFEQGAAAVAQPAELVRAQIVHDTLQDTGGTRSRIAWRQRLSAVRTRVEDWCAGLDLAPDLAEDIGSKRWLRGFGTMLGLGVFAISLWPDFSQVEAAVVLPADAALRDEFRSQMIMPLALGGDSGRHMGATAQVRALAGAPERPSLQLVATLGQGDTLAGMLSRAGLGASDAAAVGALVGTAIPISAIAPGTRFDITLGQRPAPGAPRVLQGMDFRARFDLGLSVARQGGGLALVRHPIAVDATPLRIRGPVGSSLYRSARNAGAPIAAIQDYLRAIDSHVSLETDLATTDAFDIVIAYKRSATGERQLGDLLYAGLERGGKPRLQLLRWGKAGEMVAAAALTGAVSSEPRAIGAPVAGHITSTYGMRRHPILGFVRMHAGIDFGAAYGSPIFAVADGVVSFAGRHGGHGNYVRLEHGGGNGTGYGHMSRIAVSPGAHVSAGQVIGYVGSSGLSTGPHLHFEAYQGGHTINPMGLRFAAARPQIDTHELGAFKQRLAAILAIRPGAALGAIAPAPVAVQHQAGREIDRLVDGQDTRQTPPDRLARHALASAADLRNRN
jgi:murein DD-endopeptidase MepM/ murein hydrolase activator NlpD